MTDANRPFAGKSDDELSAMEQDLKDTFSGPPAQQEEKRNRAAKSRHGEALKSQRSQ